MFAGERLRCELRGLLRLCEEMRHRGEEAGEAEAGRPAVSTTTASSLVAVNVELLQAVHERTLVAAGLLLRALETLPRSASASPSASPPLPSRDGEAVVSKPARLGAAPLVALLWAQVCQLRDCARKPAGDGQGHANPPRSSSASQTDDSCLRRCEACCVAEDAVKDLIQAFCAALEEPSVAGERSEVVAGLGAGRLSQWGAMRALTASLRRDLDAVLREGAAAGIALAEARHTAHAAQEERAAAEALRGAAEARVAELGAALQEKASLEARLEACLEEARGREADQLAQLHAARAEATAARDQADQAAHELRQARRHAEALKAEQSKLRRQLKQAHERHALLLRYPDLHGPLQPLQHEAGDPVLDMECQVQANEVRALLLAGQNERLRATISKLRVLTASGRPPTRNHSRPTSASSPDPSSSSSSTPHAAVAWQTEAG